MKNKEFCLQRPEKYLESSVVQTTLKRQVLFYIIPGKRLQVHMKGGFITLLFSFLFFFLLKYS